MKKFYQKIKNLLQSKKLNDWHYICIVLLLLISIVNLRAFLEPGIFRGHDIENHLARIANYYLAIKDGHFPPRWAKNLNHKFGYPVFNYNYPLPNILAYPLIIIGFSIEESLKIILLAAYFFSGLFFYLWAKRHFSLMAALTGAVFFVCAPYQFLDIYVRGVVGENLSFALLPTVLYFLKLCSEKPTKIRFIFLTLTTALFSLSHNVMVLIFTPIILGYLFYLLKNKNKIFVKNCILGLLLGYLSTSFFWIPAVMEQQFVNLDAFNPKNFYLDHFIPLKLLIYSPWQFGFSTPNSNETMSFQIGLAHLLSVLLGILYFAYRLINHKHYKKENFSNILSILVLFFLSIFMMLSASTFVWRLIPFLGYLQFPWRFLSLTIFTDSIIAAWLVSRKKFLGILLMFTALTYAQQFTKPFSWDKKSDMTYYDFLFTTSVRHENTPIWFSEENINTFKQRFTSTGLVTFKEISWLTGKHTYEIDASQTATIWEHTAYFPGWQAYIDNKAVKIKYDNREFPGLISFDVPKGKHLIITRFTEKTPARIVSDLLTGCALITTIFLFFKIKKTYV